MPIETTIRSFFEKPKYRRPHGDMLNYDVSRLATWKSARTLAIFIFLWLFLCGLFSAVPKLSQWEHYLNHSMWIVLILVPVGNLTYFKLTSKGTRIRDLAAHFPRSHTLKHYKPLVAVAAVLACIMLLAPFVFDRAVPANELGQIGLFFAVLVASSLFWATCTLAKTQADSGILSARLASWSPDEEDLEIISLKEQLQSIESSLEPIDLEKGNYPCGKCGGSGMAAEGDYREDLTGDSIDDDPDGSDKAIPPLCEKCNGTGKVEWLNELQQKEWNRLSTDRSRLRAELSEIEGEKSDQKPKYIKFHFPWASTETNHAAGDEISATFHASASRSEFFRQQNDLIFEQWKSLEDVDDHSKTYADCIGEWGNVYVGDEGMVLQSRELLTLSYDLSRKAITFSLSEFQQIELYLAAAQSLTRARDDEEVKPRDLEVHLSSMNCATEAEAGEKLKAIICHLWVFADTHYERLTQEENEYILGRIRYWHTAIQPNEEDVQSPLPKFNDYFNILKAYSRQEKDVEWPGTDYENIAVNSLTPIQHRELINNLKALNEISSGRSPEKHNKNQLELAKLRERFSGHDSMHSERTVVSLTHYPKFPTQTLCDDCGTPDDTAILLAGLLWDCGYEVTMYRTNTGTSNEEGIGVAVGFEGSEDSNLIDTGLIHKGKVFCEITPDGSSIGIISDSAPIPIDVPKPVNRKVEAIFEF